MGQNFLTSGAIADEIVRASGVKPDDVVLEVGPGKGILTEALLGKAGRVVAVEKDERLAEFLRKKFADRKNLKIVRGDILKFRPEDYGLVKYKIVANIPYYLTSHLLRKFLQDPPAGGQPSLMVLMVQKEVAERIAGLSVKRKKESILSISVKVYGKPKIIRSVPASYFLPKPKVDSAVLLIDKISKEFFKNCARLSPAQREKNFFEIVKKGFSSRRKLLKNNLPMLDTECLTNCKIVEKARAEELSLEQWKCLSTVIHCQN